MFPHNKTQKQIAQFWGKDLFGAVAKKNAFALFILKMKRAIGQVL